MVTAVAWELHCSADWLILVAAIIDTRLWLKAGMDMFTSLDKYRSKTNLNKPIIVTLDSLCYCVITT